MTGVQTCALPISGIPSQIKESLKIPEFVYQGVPSQSCPQGSKGRIGVFEILSNTKELEKIILENPNEGEVFKEFRHQGGLTMREDALIKILKGDISIDELDKL